MFFYCKPKRRRGLTLMEVLLVLALLVAMGAMVWPNLQRPFAAERLRRAGDQVRAHWSRARNRAIDSGEVYSFRCQLQGSRYLIERYAGLDIDQAVTSTGFAATASDNATPGTPALSIDKTLPAGVTMSDLQTEADARTSSQAMEFGNEDPSQSRDETWSTPVLFFPDGTSTTAELTLTNQYGATVMISLRGLTGGSRLGEVSADENYRAPALEKSP